jgi:hypothetical protein
MEHAMRAEQAAAAASSAELRVPRLSTTSGGYAAWRPKAEVFLSQKGLLDAVRRIVSDQDWRKWTKAVQEWSDEEINASLDLALGGITAVPVKLEQQSQPNSAGAAAVAGSDGDGNVAGSSAAAAGSAVTVKKEATVAESQASERMQQARKHVIMLVDRSQKAYGYIYSALPDELGLQVAHIARGHAYALWQWLVNKFQSTEADNVDSLLRLWSNMQQTAGESFDAYRARVNELSMLLELAEEKPSPRVYKFKLLHHLQPCYDTVVLALTNGAHFKDVDPQKVNWDAVTAQINGYERSLAEANGAAAAAKVMAVQQQKDHRKPGGSHGKGPQCWKCGEVGHVKANCPKRTANGGGTAGSDGKTTNARPGQGVANIAVPTNANPFSDLPDPTHAVSFAAVGKSTEQGSAHAAVAPAAELRLMRVKQLRVGVDSMASMHISGDASMIFGLEECDPVSVLGMDGGEVTTRLRGRMELHLDANGRKSTVVVEHVYYHPKFAANLLGMVKLSKLGWKLVCEEGNSCVVTPAGHKVPLHTGQGVTMLHCAVRAKVDSTGSAQGVVCTAASPPSAEALELLRLHERLGHASWNRLAEMMKKKATLGLASMPSSPLVLKEAQTLVQQCTACTVGKGSRTAFGHRGMDKGSASGEVLHMDLFYVKFQHELKTWVEYGLTISDSHSGAWFFQRLLSKGEGPLAVLDLIRQMQTQGGWKVKRLYADGGGEFVNGLVVNFAKTQGIELHWPPAKTAQLNGVAERKVRTGKDMGRTMLLAAGLPGFFWKYAIPHAVFVWNRTFISPHTSMTPFEALYKRKPTLDHWGIFGCDAFYHIPKEQRAATFDAKMVPCIYLGHNATQNCAMVFDLQSKKLVYTRDVKYRLARFTHAGALVAGGEFLDGVIASGYSEDETPVGPGVVPAVELGCDAGEQEVERIVAKRAGVGGQVEYQVRWVGEDELTWEPSYNLEGGAAEAIADYEKSVSSVEAEAVGWPDHSDAQHAVVDGMGSRAGGALSPVASESSTAAQSSSSQPDVVEVPRPAAAAAEPVQMQGEPQRRSARGHASSRAADASRLHVHMAMSAMCDVQSGGVGASSNDDEQLQMVHAVSNALTQLEKQTPTTYAEAMASPERLSWKEALAKEMASINEMEVWDLVPRSSVPPPQTVLKCKWVFKIKTNEHGAITVYKARLTPKGFMQREGINVYETFAATGKYKSMRIGLSIAAACDYELDQMDVPVAFQQAELEEEVYMELPDGFREGKEHLVCKLKKALYGLKQAPRNWWKLISQFLTEQLGFKPTVSDPCLFFKRSSSGRLLVLFLFVDDMQVGYHIQDKLEWDALKAKLVQRFNTKDMGPSTWILGMRITRNRKARTIVLDQELYVTKALERHGMLECKPVSTPEVVSGSSSAGGEDEEKQLNAPADLQLFQEMVGTLMYAAVSCRLDIAHAVHALASDMQAPTGASMLAAKRVLRYLAGTKNIGLVFGSLASGNAEASDTRGRGSKTRVDVCAYADADWANNKKDRKSITGWVAKLNGDPISWASKKQRVVALSTCEAELYAEAAAIQEVLWLRDLLAEMGLPAQWGSTVHGDNQSTLAVSKNGVKADRTKHVDVKYHFITQTVDEGSVRLKWIPTTEQQADIFTKPLAAPVFELLRGQLMTR